MEAYKNVFADLPKPIGSHKRIKNKHYRKFLDEGIIKTLDEAYIKDVIAGIKGKHIAEARSLVILLYYSGARPNEVLKVKAKDVVKEGRYVIVKLVGSKKGLPRSVYLPFVKPLVKELWKYASSVYMERLLFYNYRNSYVRNYITKKGYPKQRIESTTKLYYHFTKWFGDITPYYLRHNRFSKLAQKGVTMENLRMLKGSKTFDSVTPYLHLSEAAAKAVARKME